MPEVGESSSLATSFAPSGTPSPALRPVIERARRAARSAANVLITGESGTGKRSLAEWIHASGVRAAGPLVRVASGTVGEERLIVAAHERVRHGMFGDAAGGTLVLDELCELSHEAQAALVQLLDAPDLRAYGAHGTRVIATTQHAADRAIRAGELRADLYYAIGVIAITVPPLRDRAEDMPALVAAFLTRASRGTVTITSAALAWLAGAAWPGNVRELESTIERAVALSDDGVIDVEDVAELQPAMSSPITARAPRRRRSLLK